MLPSRGSVVPAKFSACGIHVTSFQSIMGCDVRIRKNLYAVERGTHMVKVLCQAHEPLDGEITTVGTTVCSETVRSSLSTPKPFRCAEVLFLPKTHELPDAYELSDSNILTVGVKRFRYAEVLCQPAFGQQFQSNMECGVYIRKNLVANVVLSRGICSWRLL